MPRDAGARKRAAGRKDSLPDASFLRDPHLAPREGVADVRPMEMTVMTGARREGATQQSLLFGLLQSFANRFALPACLKRIGKGARSLTRGDGGEGGQGQPNGTAQLHRVILPEIEPEIPDSDRSYQPGETR